ncbi:MAG: right-handed parallel beta-helix repeat-containing protein [Polyangiaceae bacterium]|nr:right-handed parallel beta-helix repeat-containing protein [Myxococcales bacterium]MCB9583888.1 right-handed parallel beta-helix repeat-containing protein [Polyangiaceae bacterium]MCB9607856.1 right-handed parallel beta-helix repeat-containing protein [Polyangiaceae bacterium]
MRKVFPWFLVSTLAAAGLVACGSDGSSDGSGGSGGGGNGGSNAGGNGATGGTGAIGGSAGSAQGGSSQGGSAQGGSAQGGTAGVSGSGGSGGNVTIGDCNDGIDNDGDGFTDWGSDLGCANADDDETSGTRGEEDGFTTYDVAVDSQLVYVSDSEGDDNNDGSTPATAVKTLTKGASLVRDGENDFLLLKRGDTWRGENLGRFKSGKDAAHPLVIAGYGESTALPRIEVDRNFIDHNGKARSFVHLVGLEIVSYPKIPGDSAFDGASGGGLRYVGGGSGLLIEGCHFLYGELVFQSYDVEHYDGIEVRRNVIERNYHADTCGNNSAYRPSGIYSSHVDNLLIEENLLDHNGWNEDQVSSACATIYNHDMYLNADHLVIRGNIIARASSMGIKMRADDTGGADDLVFENNLIVDGEIGIGIGGNSDLPDRFSNVQIKDNVFTQIGLSQPTNRPFAWLLDVADNATATIEGNYFLHQPWHNNGYGISIGSGSASNITINDNLFYDLKGNGIILKPQSGWSNVAVTKNRIIDPTNGSCLIKHEGSFAAVSYADNEYSSGSGQRFCVDGSDRDLAAWKSASGESTAAAWSGSFSDPDRTLGSYSGTVGLPATIEGFLDAALKQSRLNWRTDLQAAAVNDYIRAGFN